MLNKITVVTDLGPGDGGKGSIVHKLCCNPDVSVVIKRGGAQGSHGVRTSHNESFNFSQWGCGTFNGIPTYCSEQMILSPVGLENESDALKHCGIYDPFALLSADPKCVCATPFHRIASQLEELKRGSHPRGTIGSGVGQAQRMFSKLGDICTIRAHELTDVQTIRKKLQIQRDYYLSRYARYPKHNGLPEDDALISDNLALLGDPEFLPYITDVFTSIGQQLTLNDLSTILEQEGEAIVECSHGVLTDAVTGLQPHVSAIRTLPEFTEHMLRDAGYEEQIIHLAVHRAYEIRHGAGPMPTYDPFFTERMLPDSHKDTNRWQGIVRAGPLDINLMKYALNASKAVRFDALCLTWFDQVIQTDRNWRLCIAYRNTMAMHSKTELFSSATPVIEDHPIRQQIPATELFEYIDRTLRNYIGIPLYMLSVGATENKKLISSYNLF